MKQRELEVTAKAIIDSNLYMTLGTADEEGRPWATPVYFAPDGYSEFLGFSGASLRLAEREARKPAPRAGRFLWVSAPETRHSMNLAARPELGIVIFDSRHPIGTGQGVYMSAVAGELVGSDRDRATDIFSGRGVSHGGEPWTLEDVSPPARHRLYRAVASEHFVLGPHDGRTPVSLE